VRLRIGVPAALAAVLVAAGCGGSAGGNKPASGGSSVAPGNAVAYVSADSNLDSAAWTKVKTLLDRFPGKDKLIADLKSSLKQQGLDWETDVQPALGSELDVVWLDFKRNGDNVVGLTQPKDSAKFDALLAKASTPLVHEQVDGWTVFAQTQALLDRFDQARSDNGSLGDDSAFSDPWGALPSDSITRAWVRGGNAQAALDQRLHTSGLPADTTKNQFGTLDSITAALTPGSDGIKLGATFSGDLNTGASSYQAKLPGVVPAGAIAYVSFSGLGGTLNKLLDTYGKTIPNFDQQRAQIELALGYPLNDVFDLFDGEDGLAVYKGKAGIPDVLLAAAVNNETKAHNILNRLASLATATGSLHVQTVQIGPVDAKEIALSNGTTVYAAVFDGNLVITNSRTLVEDMQGAGPKLSDDSAYQAAVAGARVPQETSGFVYADLKATLDYAFSYEESHGTTVPQVVKDNTAPLRGLLLYGSTDGGDVTVTGFLGIQ
jgi:uncharacterized protein DUF3352